MAQRLLGFVRSLPDHSLLDRVIRGRIWIPLLGVLLVGIVAMQVEVLKLNAGIGRSVEQTTTVQSENDLLRALVSTLSSDRRIETKAAQMGMLMAPPTADKFLPPAADANVRAAIAGIHQPGSVTFSPPVGTASAAAAAASAGSTAVQ